jgi:ubiquinone/menaquinone biosynthesis C-methylase UbiE
MSPRDDDAVAVQRRYYTDTASRYESMHAREGDDDPWNLRLVCALLRFIDAQSVLDVGAGTGRGVRHLQAALPGLRVCGIEPVAALIEQAGSRNEVSRGGYIRASGEALPFEDASFDAVCSFAILHHVPKPSAVIGEMLRVARKAVLILDSNRFGQGPWPVRAAKLALYKAGLWRFVNYVKTGGKGYSFTEGDGVAYSYSAYDSFDQIARWADRLMILPSEPGKAISWLHPLLTARGVLVAAFKEEGE